MRRKSVAGPPEESSNGGWAPAGKGAAKAEGDFWGCLHPDRVGLGTAAARPRWALGAGVHGVGKGGGNSLVSPGQAREVAALSWSLSRAGSGHTPWPGTQPSPTAPGEQAGGVGIPHPSFSPFLPFPTCIEPTRARGRDHRPVSVAGAGMGPDPLHPQRCRGQN